MDAPRSRPTGSASTTAPRSPSATPGGRKACPAPAPPPCRRPRSRSTPGRSRSRTRWRPVSASSRDGPVPALMPCWMLRYCSHRLLWRLGLRGPCGRSGGGVAPAVVKPAGCHGAPRPICRESAGARESSSIPCGDRAFAGNRTCGDASERPSAPAIGCQKLSRHRSRCCGSGSAEPRSLVVAGHPTSFPPSADFHSSRLFPAVRWSTEVVSGPVR